jgi:hypothetical protein
MQLEVEGSADPVGEALRLASDAVTDHTENHPLTPELFWVYLEDHGFGFRGDPPGADEHGRFFAHVVLDHAVALAVVSGNTALHHYWPL